MSGQLLRKYGERLFNEEDRISIYRKATRICQMCRDEEEIELEAKRPSRGNYRLMGIWPGL